MSETEFYPHVLRDREGEKGIADVVLVWWARLMEAEDLLKRYSATSFPSASAVRAELRRAVSPDDALLTEGFRHLWLTLPSGRRRPWDMRAWGCVATVLATVRHHDSGRTFAARMGAEAEPGAGKPRVGELRFHQLLRSNDLEELMRRARRTVRLLGDQVHVLSLADDLLHWHQEKGGDLAPRPDARLAVRWANDYFTELARYQHA